LYGSERINLIQKNVPVG